MPSVWRANRPQPAEHLQADMDSCEIPSFLRKQSDTDSRLGDIKFNPSNIYNEDDFSPDDLLCKFNDLSVETNNFPHITMELMERISQGEVWTLVCDGSSLTGNVDLSWACLINWLTKNVTGIAPLNRHALRILNVELSKLDKPTQQKVNAMFAKSFANISANSWGLLKAQEKRTLIQRLKKIMA